MIYILPTHTHTAHTPTQTHKCRKMCSKFKGCVCCAELCCAFMAVSHVNMSDCMTILTSRLDANRNRHPELWHGRGALVPPPYYVLCTISFTVSSVDTHTHTQSLPLLLLAAQHGVYFHMFYGCSTSSSIYVIGRRMYTHTTHSP